VFMRTIYRLLDEYALTLPGAVLNRAYATASGASPAIAKIDKRRYLMCTEVPKRPLDEAFVKALSGSDPLSARKLYTDQTEFQPQGKLWLSVNEMPPVSFDDDAMWRRLVPIPLKRQFRGANRDPNLEDALCKELSGILNWALEGASRYASTGLKLCKASRVLRLRLRKGVDTVGEWINAECIVGIKSSVPAAMAYEAYSYYMSRQRLQPLSMPQFKATMRRKGFTPKKTKRYNVYLGLRLRDSR
jgi:putative DNA primase/helicase